jgi:hypothetical protein
MVDEARRKPSEPRSDQRGPREARRNWVRFVISLWGSLVVIGPLILIIDVSPYPGA